MSKKVVTQRNFKNQVSSELGLTIDETESKKNTTQLYISNIATGKFKVEWLNELEYNEAAISSDYTISHDDLEVTVDNMIVYGSSTTSIIGFALASDVRGGKPPYSYSWTYSGAKTIDFLNKTTPAAIGNLKAGEGVYGFFQLVVTDSRGVAASDTANITWKTVPVGTSPPPPENDLEIDEPDIEEPPNVVYPPPSPAVPDYLVLEARTLVQIGGIVYSWFKAYISVPQLNIELGSCKGYITTDSENIIDIGAPLINSYKLTCLIDISKFKNLYPNETELEIIFTAWWDKSHLYSPLPMDIRAETFKGGEMVFDNYLGRWKNNGGTGLGEIFSKTFGVGSYSTSCPPDRMTILGTFTYNLNTDELAWN